MSTHHAAHAVARFEETVTLPRPLGPPMEPERAPGKNALQKMAAMMRDQTHRLAVYRELEGRSPQGERARAVTMLRVAIRSGHLLPLAGGSHDLTAFGSACAALRDELLK
jgi:hypothetical protein